MAKNSWTAEKRSMEKTFALITGKKTKIIDIKPPEDELGYTSADQTIHLAEKHPIMNGLNNTEKIAFRKGIFSHEMLHQIFTDFEALKKVLMKVKGHERKIFADICNILEDPAIEYLAPTAISGPLLKSLRFAIAYTYKKSSRVEEHKTAMGQYLTALIHFGDMGLIKGYFTFSEAKKCFAETAEIFEKGITEPNAAKRLGYAKEIFEISRPLWQAEADMEKLLQELAEMLTQHGKAPMNGEGCGKNVDSSDIPETKKDKRRKVTIKKVTKEELENLKKSGSISSEPPSENEDITILVCDENLNDDAKGANPTSVPADDKKGDASKEKSDEKSMSEENANDSSEDIEEGGKSTKEPSTKEDSRSESEKNSTKDDLSDDSISENESTKEKSQGFSDSSKKDSANNVQSDTSNKTSDEGNPVSDQSNNSSKATDKQTKINGSKDAPFRVASRDGDTSIKPVSSTEIDEDIEDVRIDEDEYSLSEDDVESILSDLLRSEEEEKAASAKDDSVIPDYDISSPKMPRKSCLNYRVTFPESHRDALEQAYAETINKMAVGIRSTTNALKRIFEDDKEEREYRNSGSISLKRLYCGSVTSQIFERKIAPADKRDLAVEILVDESGSMFDCGKYIAAQKCCIALAEIFNNLNVPVYVMGFTADTQKYDVVHLHYVTWKNTRNDRLKLLNIAARADNCDGASIRYATEVLKKKQAKNKLLIVLSDGMPAALNYHNGDADTKDAIRAAKKHASVLGVAIGNNDTKAIQYLYEKDFLHISKVEDLFAGVAKKMKNIIKSW